MTNTPQNSAAEATNAYFCSGSMSNVGLQDGLLVATQGPRMKKPPSLADPQTHSLVGHHKKTNGFCFSPEMTQQVASVFSPLARASRQPASDGGGFW